MSKKSKLYNKAGGHCQWKLGCDVEAFDLLTIDHIMPKSIAKIKGFNRKYYNHISNLQLLCVEHHRLKDRDNYKRIENEKTLMELFSTRKS